VSVRDWEPLGFEACPVGLASNPSVDRNMRLRRDLALLLKKEFFGRDCLEVAGWVHAVLWTAAVKRKI